MYQHIRSQPTGDKIRVNADFSLSVPDNPIIPFIDGGWHRRRYHAGDEESCRCGCECRPTASKRQISWMEIYAGEKSTHIYGEKVWLPDETLEAAKEYVVSIKGPLTTPVGGGIRSINVALRQKLDLYVCLRPVRYFQGVPSPLKNPEKTDMVIFRENSEDIYAGIEWEAGSDDAKKIIHFLMDDMGVTKIRFPETSAIGIKPVSREGTERLVRKAIQYAIDNNRRSVTLVHKGNIMKFTEGAFKNWGYHWQQGIRRNLAGRWAMDEASRRQGWDRYQGCDRGRFSATDFVASGGI